VNSLRELIDHGHSYWLDNLTRRAIKQNQHSDRDDGWPRPDESAVYQKERRRCQHIGPGLRVNARWRSLDACEPDYVPLIERLYSD
jgi:hypothetical protein